MFTFFDQTSFEQQQKIKLPFLVWITGGSHLIKTEVLLKIIASMLIGGESGAN